MKIKEWFDPLFWRFVLVGLANTLIGNGLGFLLINLTPMGVWASTAISYTLASVASYFLNKHFTFRHAESGWRPMVRFATNIAVCWVVAYGIAEPVTLHLMSAANPNLRENVSMLVGMVLFMILNYLGQRLLVFPQREQE